MATENLPVKLTTEEILQMGGENARANAALQRLADDKAAVNADFKQQGDKLKAGINYRSGCINTGTEFRDVEVTYITDRENGVMRSVRMDTGEEFNVRPLTPDERQLRLLAEHDEDDTDLDAEQDEGETENVEGSDSEPFALQTEPFALEPDVEALATEESGAEAVAVAASDAVIEATIEPASSMSEDEAPDEDLGEASVAPPRRSRRTRTVAVPGSEVTH